MERRPIALHSVLALLAGLAGSAVWAAPGVPEVSTLANGLKLVVLEDHASPLVAVSLWVRCGSRDEIESSAGYAHYLEHLVQRGAAGKGPFEHQRLAYRWGGGLSVRASYDRTHVTLTGVPGALQDMLQAAAAMAFRADLKDTEIDAELGSLSTEMRNYYDDPASVAFLESVRAAFPGHPYRFPPLGHFKTIGTLKRGPLLGFYRNLWVPNNMALAIAGDVPPGRAAAMAEAVFGTERRSGTLPSKPPGPAAFPGHDDIEKRLNLRDPWTTLVFTAPGYRHPDRPAFEVMSRWLGDAGGSPILSALVGARAGSSARVLYYRLEDAGMLYVALVPSTPELSYDAANTALEEIARFKKEGLGPAELREVVAQLGREERQRAERIEERADGLAEALLFGGIRYYWDLPAAYARLTPGDITRVAATWLQPENARLVVILPKTAAPSSPESKEKTHATLERLRPAAGTAAPAPEFARSAYPAAEADRPGPRSWGDPADAGGLQPARTIRLDNGLTVVLQRDARFGLLGVSVQLRAGAADDPAGREGLAWMAGRLLAANATPAPERAAAAARPDIVPLSDVGRDLTEIRALVGPADLRRLLAGLARALREPAVPQPAFDALRRAALEGLERPPEASGAALELFREKVYAGHPYARPVRGTAPGLQALTADEVREFLDRRAAPSETVLGLAGSFDVVEAEAMVRDLFGSWKRRADKTDGAAAAGGDTVAPAVAGARTGEFTRILSAPQSHVMVGVPGPALGRPDVEALRLLGTTLTVLSFEDMVFRRRAAFSAAAVPEVLRDGGSLAIGVVAAHPRRDEAVFDVQKLMRRLALEPLPPAEMEDMMRVQAGREATAGQGVLALASTLSYNAITGSGNAPGGATPSPETLRDAAARLLRPEAWIVVRVGPSVP